MIKLGVVGHPIAHSKSPLIHGQFAKQLGVAIEYERYDIKPKDFDRFVSDFFAGGGHGLNVTLPHKGSAFLLSSPATEKVSLAKAVNTLSLDKKGQLTGDNTDGAGLVKDLTVNHGVDLAHKKILILGAGGAVRGILPALIEMQPSMITVSNRSMEKAEGLKLELSKHYKINTLAYDELGGDRFDLIINGTSMGITGQMPAISSAVLAETTVCYDLMYAAQPTAFVQWGMAKHAALAVDGFGMLVEQAAESFAIWTSQRPNTKPVYQSLRQ
ncbi:MAG: shikimate dehydrogenase [Pseudohongiellaceae bacterium]